MEENFQVRDEKVEENLRGIGNIIKDQMPPGMGFTLFMFDYGDGGNMFYISSAKREDMIKSMEEFIQKEKNAARPPNR